MERLFLVLEVYRKGKYVCKVQKKMILEIKDRLVILVYLGITIY